MIRVPSTFCFVLSSFPLARVRNILTPLSFLYWPLKQAVPTEPESAGDVRKRELTYSDPVHRINLVQLVREQLQQAVVAAGGSARFEEEWLSRVDKDVLQAFQSLGVM